MTDEVLLDNTGTPYVEIERDANGAVSSARRADGLWDIPVDLPNDTLLALALEAHRQNITLNDLMVQVLVAAIDAAEANRVLDQADDVSGNP